MNGILIVNKEKNYTSRDIVNIVGRKFNTRKVGHTGTLDPMATGVLVICINSATKMVELLQADDKEYIAEITLGIDTDTLDITGNIVEEKNTIISKEKVTEAIKSMKGFYEQVVPIYSAVKINGKKLYEYARNNENIELPKRKIEIKEIELISDIKYINNKTIFSIRCVVSSGCYIRSLAKDIAVKLNAVGVMSSLNRVREGIFKIEDAYTLEDIDKDNYKIIELNKDMFPYKKIIVDNDPLMFKIKNGALVNNDYAEDIVLFIDKFGNLLALYKKYDKDSSLLKPWKMFKGGN